MIPDFNDDHLIDENFQKLKFLIQQAEQDIYKFIGPTRNRKAGRRSRKKLIKIKIEINSIFWCSLDSRCMS